jgi:hypothetical protein
MSSATGTRRAAPDRIRSTNQSAFGGGALATAALGIRCNSGFGTAPLSSLNGRGDHQGALTDDERRFLHAQRRIWWMVMGGIAMNRPDAHTLILFRGEPAIGAVMCAG